MDMISPKTISANGLQFGYLELGNGPLVLCVHGYPDTAYTWDHLLPILADAGYRAVAPFTRGYPPSTAPADGDYSAIQLGTDMVALIEALGAEQAIVIGHDWGALAAYAAANLQPKMISRLVTVAIPHPRTIRFNAKTLRKSHHFLTYQLRRRAVRQLRRNGMAHVDEIYRRWSPTWSFPPSETQRVKEAFAQPGAIEAALGYYWSFAANRNNEALQKTLARKTDVPTLCIVGADDGALDLDTMPHTPNAFSGPYNYAVLPGVGHFLHRETPEQFAKLVLDFIGPA